MLQEKHGSQTLCQHEKYFMIDQEFYVNEEIPLLTFLLSSVKIYQQVPYALNFILFFQWSQAHNVGITRV